MHICHSWIKQLFLGEGFKITTVVFFLIFWQIGLEVFENIVSLLLVMYSNCPFDEQGNTTPKDVLIF